jgi:hypothetical protein
MRFPFVRPTEADVRARARLRLAAEERTRLFVAARPPILPTSDPLGMRTPTRARRPRPSYPIVAVTTHELPAFVQERLSAGRLSSPRPVTRPRRVTLRVIARMPSASGDASSVASPVDVLDRLPTPMRGVV